MNQQHPNQIANPQTSEAVSQVKDATLNDRDRVNDVLNTEKYLCMANNIAAWEASHAQLHQDMMTVVNETQQCHRNLFNLMFAKGWYKLEAEQQQKLDQTHQQFSNYSSQFPYASTRMQ